MAPQDAELQKLIDRDATAAMQTRLADLAAATVKPRWQATALLVHAEYLRELRNYGVHPRAAIGAEEHAIQDDTAGLLILTTRRYLKQFVAVMTEAFPP